MISARLQTATKNWQLALGKHASLSNCSATTAGGVSSSAASTHLAELLDLRSLYADDGASQALVDQQAQLAVKIHAIVMLVLQSMIQLIKFKKKK